MSRLRGWDGRDTVLRLSSHWPKGLQLLMFWGADTRHGFGDTVGNRPGPGHPLFEIHQNSPRVISLSSKDERILQEPLIKAMHSRDKGLC